MAFSILRVTKHKNPGKIQAIGKHNSRERVTLNANPAVANRNLMRPSPTSASNVAEAGEAAIESQGQSSAGDAWDAVKVRIKEAQARIRKNGVLACEVFMGASPEFFRPNGGDAGTWDEQRLTEWEHVAMTWLKQEWGEKNIVAADLHLDETTPHIHAVVVPIDLETGRLNAARWLDGRKNLSAMQDRHGEAMQQLGLERGIRGSTAEYMSVRDWYAHLQKSVPQVPMPQVQTPGALVLLHKARESFAQDESARLATAQQPAIEALQTQARAHDLAVKKQRSAEATSKRLVAELQVERKAGETRAAAGADREQRLLVENATQRKGTETLRSALDNYRRVPLSEAVGWFDPEELVEAGVRIGTNAQGQDRVFAANGDLLGRNAIDLTMAVHGCTTAGQAAAWIEARQGRVAANRAIRTSSNLDKLLAEARPCREVVRDPQQGLMFEERSQRAQDQVAQRRPSSWEGVQKIFARMRLELVRAWKATEAAYTLVDALFEGKGEVRHHALTPPAAPGAAQATGTAQATGAREPKKASPSPVHPPQQEFWTCLRDLENVERARLQRLQREEEAATQAAATRRGLRR